MEGVAVIAIYTMVTLDVCATIWIGKTFAEYICKVVHYINREEKES